MGVSFGRGYCAVFWGMTITLNCFSRVTKQKFLLTISVHFHTEKQWEVRKISTMGYFLIDTKFSKLRMMKYTADSAKNWSLYLRGERMDALNIQKAAAANVELRKFWLLVVDHSKPIFLWIFQCPKSRSELIGLWGQGRWSIFIKRHLLAVHTYRSAWTMEELMLTLTLC